MKKTERLWAAVCLGTALCLTAFPGKTCSWASEPEARLTTIAGVPGNGYADGAGERARFSGPQGLDIRQGSLLVADTDNQLIRCWSGSRLITLAGNRSQDNAYGTGMGGFRDSSPSRALFHNPTDCLYLADGRVVIADRDNHTIRIIGKAWVYTLNGTGEEGYREGKPGEARFSRPSGLAEGVSGRIYVADSGNHCIRTIDRNGVTSLTAGVPGQGGFKDGPVEEALFLEPSAVVRGSDGCIYVADTGNQRIRKIADGQVTTVAGGAQGFYLDTEYRQPGFADGRGAEAGFWFPQGICAAGRVILVADTGNHAIRAVSPSGQVRVIAGNGEAGYRDGGKEEAMLNRPCDVAWENGVVYIADTGNSAIRSIVFDPEQWLESLGE